MKNIVLILSLTLVYSFNASSQDEQINVNAINNYKYVIIPLKYDILSDVDKYQINSLTKFLFNKYGYTAFLENDSFPDDLRQNNCLALKADVVEAKGGFLSTRLKINLMDCNGQLVVSSKSGKSREKEFKVAYNLALRNAFQSFQFHKYKYKPDPSLGSISPTNSSAKPNVEEPTETQEEIDRLKQEVAVLKEKKEIKSAVIVPVVGVSTIDKKIIKSSDLKEDAEILYAQPIDNGFQVIDKTPKVIMILLNTPKENTFIVKDENAIVYREDGFWYLSKNDGNSSSLETLNIKF